MTPIEKQKTKRLAQNIDAIFPLHPKVKEAIESIPREIFIPLGFKHHAYKLDALPITASQWISSPLTVAKMTQFLEPFNVDKVLEIGCGSGYQAAILSQIVRRVFTVERIEKLVIEAKIRFKELELYNINLRYADGMLGWKEFAPYERILFSAAIKEVPKTLFEQLQNGGILVAPIIKEKNQVITRFIKENGHISEEVLDSCQFIDSKVGVE